MMCCSTKRFLVLVTFAKRRATIQGTSASGIWVVTCTDLLKQADTKMLVVNGFGNAWIARKAMSLKQFPEDLARTDLSMVLKPGWADGNIFVTIFERQDLVR